MPRARSIATIRSAFRRMLALSEATFGIVTRSASSRTIAAS